MIQAAWCRKTPEFRTPAGVTINWSNAHIGITNVGLGIFLWTGCWTLKISHDITNKYAKKMLYPSLTQCDVFKCWQAGKPGTVQFQQNLESPQTTPKQSIAQLQWHMDSFAKHEKFIRSNWRADRRVVTDTVVDVVAHSLWQDKMGKLEEIVFPGFSRGN